MNTEKYRLMIYFIVATIQLYEASVIMPKDEQISVDDFIKNNRDLMNRVFDEAINCFNYEISSHQLEKGVYAWMSSKYNPQFITDKEAYNPNIYEKEINSIR